MKLSPNLTNLLWVLAKGRPQPITRWHTITLASAYYRGYIRYTRASSHVQLTDFGKRIQKRIANASYESWKSSLADASSLKHRHENKREKRDGKRNSN